MIKLRLLCTQLTSRYTGEYAPNVEAAWDENEIDQNSEGWSELVKKAQQNLVSGEYESVAVITVGVEGADLYSAPKDASPSDPDWIEHQGGLYGLRLIVAEFQDGSERWVEIVDAWDEYVLDENNEGFQKKLDEERAKVGTNYSWLKTIDLYFDSAAIDKALAPWQEVHQGRLTVAGLNQVAAPELPDLGT